jgi:hypothetical protein
MSKRTTLKNADEISAFDVNDIVFDKTEEKKLSDSVKYFRIPIKAKSSKDKLNDLYIVLDQCYCFGVSDKYGLAMGISLEDREGPTEHQSTAIQLFNQIADRCKEVVVERKLELKLPAKMTTSSDKLDNIGCVKYKLDSEGNIDTTKAPTMNLKFTLQKKDKEGNELAEPKLMCLFKHEETLEDLSIFDLLDKPFYVRSVIHIEGIFVGQQIKLQAKLRECLVQPIENTSRSILMELKQNNAFSKKSTAALEPEEEETNEDEVEVAVGSGETEEESRPQILEEDNEEEVVLPKEDKKEKKPRRGAK